MLEIVWIIGGSNGIGLELVKQFLNSNYKVIVSSRSASRSIELSNLKVTNKENIHLVDIDVSDTVSVIEATKKSWSIHKRIDLCIYNAGVYESMKISTWKLEHFESMNQVNYMGAIRILTEITPLFEKQNYGHIAFNISISSYFGLPYGGGYSAPKAALLNFCESIQPELIKKNIKIQVINHGFVKTRLTAKNKFKMPQILDADEAAKKIYNGVINSKKFEIKFPWGLTNFLQLLRVLPYSVALRLTKKAL